MGTDRKLRKTLCWDCANATGHCTWSRKLEPVPGWTATMQTINERSKADPIIESYIVHQCPGFERDSYEWGSVRKNEKSALKMALA